MRSMRTEDRANNVARIIEKSVAEVKPKVLTSLNTVQLIELRFIRIVSAYGLSEHISAFNNLFQWEKLKTVGGFSKGFPGVVLTAVVGRLLDPNYDPANHFYNINPRPLFEQAIRPVLVEKYHAPMGKSDPLNVAKNANVIDVNWARDKRPEYAALATAELVAVVSKASGDELERFLNVMLWAYLSLSTLFTREMPEIKQGIETGSLSFALQVLITDAPAGGDTAQEVVGALLQAQHSLFGVEGYLEGVGESAFSTNTTSKKAGDFIELLGGCYHIYEVTTKKVDQQRLTESANAVSDYLMNNSYEEGMVAVTFLCREFDVQVSCETGSSHLPYLLGFCNAAGIPYNFVNIWAWIALVLERLGPVGRNTAVALIRDYVERSSSLTVKRVWEMIVRWFN